MAQGFILAVLFGLIAVVSCQVGSCTLTGCAVPNCAGATDTCTLPTCFTCQTGYFRDETHKNCCLLPTGCAEARCDADGRNVVCTKCVSSSVLASGACTTCVRPAGCATCDIAAGVTICATCETGKTKAADGKCCTLPAGCKTLSTCADPTTGAVCTACQPGYFLSGVGAAATCTQCTAAATGDDVSKFCFASVDAYTCTSATTSKCTRCPTDTTNTKLAANGRCCVHADDCATIHYCDGDGTTNLECATCAVGYFHNVASGVLANGGIDCDPCTFVAGNDCKVVGDLVYHKCTTAVDSTCTECAVGSSINAAGKCCPTIANCAVQGTCPTGGKRTCTTCMAGYYLTVGVEADSCTPCTSIPSNCKTYTCTTVATAAVCSACNDGFWFNAATKTCSACSTGSCPTGNRVTALCTATADRVCSPYTVCPANQYAAKAGSGETDTLCLPCRATCANCATNDCVSCTACAADYVFTLDRSGCEVACGNNRLDATEDETCDDGSEACVDCHCAAGYRADGQGGCVDIDECAVYTCAFNDAEAVVCTNNAPNQRTCTCQDDRLVRTLSATEPTTNTAVLDGNAPFAGCTDADLSIDDFIAVLGSERGRVVGQFAFNIWVPGSVVRTATQDEDDGLVWYLVVDFPDGDVDTTAIAHQIDEYLSDLFLIDADDLTVGVQATSAKRAQSVTFVGTFSEDALASASSLFPVLAVFSALLALIH